MEVFLHYFNFFQETNIMWTFHYFMISPKCYEKGNTYIANTKKGDALFTFYTSALDCIAYTEPSRYPWNNRYYEVEALQSLSGDNTEHFSNKITIKHVFKDVEGFTQFVKEDECMECIQNLSFVDVFKNFPPHLRTEKVCWMAVKQNPFNLEYVPELLKDEAICQLAFQGNPNTIKYAPNFFRTRDRCAQSVFGPSLIEDQNGDDIFREEGRPQET
jgi:hypothetical protein